METLDAKLAERSLIREKKACIDRSQRGPLFSESFPYPYCLAPLGTSLIICLSQFYFRMSIAKAILTLQYLCCHSQALLQLYLNIGDSVHKIEKLMGLTENALSAYVGYSALHFCHAKHQAFMH
jgi:hypothetical protein